MEKSLMIATVWFFSETALRFARGRAIVLFRRFFQNGKLLPAHSFHADYSSRGWGLQRVLQKITHLKLRGAFS
jgi:hypothetical protein